MSRISHFSRRKFLKKTAQLSAGALVFPSIVPASALGKNGVVAPSNRVIIGCIGMGGMGNGNMKNFMSQPDVKVVAVCDVDASRLEKAKNMVDDNYQNKDCKAYRDYREVVSRTDIDAISLSTPDHWHALPAVAAAESGKDIYGEKPLSHSLKEGRAMCDAVRRYNRVWQTGSMQRSMANFRFACELVQNGRIGKVHTAEVGLPGGGGNYGSGDRYEVQDPPKELDYDFWLGPAPYSPYIPARTHYQWRWHLDFGGGQLMDWVGHHVDIAHWGLGLDYDAPVEVEGKGEFPKDGPWNAARRYRINTRYKNGIKMVIAGGHDDIKVGTKWIGDKGWVWVNRGRIDAHPRRLLKEKIGPSEVRLYQSTSHHRNFIDCIKSREATITPCEVAQHSQTPGHLGQIAMLLGRKIRFDPNTEEIIGDPTATRMLGSPMRSPWHY